jgi:hypothetical protein
MHTILYCDPEGTDAFTVDKDPSKSTQRTVPAGHVNISVPLNPVGPCCPRAPDTNSDGFALAAAWHPSKVTLIPLAPAAGLLSVVVANDAVSARILLALTMLDVTLSKAKSMFCVVIVSFSPNGK